MIALRTAALAVLTSPLRGRPWRRPPHAPSGHDVHHHAVDEAARDGGAASVLPYHALDEHVLAPVLDVEEERVRAGDRQRRDGLVRHRGDLAGAGADAARDVDEVARGVDEREV